MNTLCLWYKLIAHQDEKKNTNKSYWTKNDVNEWKSLQLWVCIIVLQVKLSLSMKISLIYCFLSKKNYASVRVASRFAFLLITSKLDYFSIFRFTGHSLWKKRQYECIFHGKIAWNIQTTFNFTLIYFLKSFSMFFLCIAYIFMAV